MKTLSPSSELAPPRYKATFAPLTSWVATALWTVVIGISNIAGVDSLNLVVRDVNQNALDNIGFTKDTAAGFIWTYLPKRLLVPQGGFVFSNLSSQNLQLIECNTLEDALAIL